MQDSMDLRFDSKTRTLRPTILRWTGTSVVMTSTQTDSGSVHSLRVNESLAAPTTTPVTSETDEPTSADQVTSRLSPSYPRGNTVQAPTTNCRQTMMWITSVMHRHRATLRIMRWLDAQSCPVAQLPADLCRLMQTNANRMH